MTIAGRTTGKRGVPLDGECFVRKQAVDGVFEPAHFRVVVGGFVRDDDVSSGKEIGESALHAVGSANDVMTECGVGLIHPGGGADATGYGVDLRDGEPVFGEDEIGADDVGEGIAEGGAAGDRDQLSGFTLVEELGDPRGRGVFGGGEVEVVASAKEAEEGGAEAIDLGGEFFTEQEGGR